MRHVHKHLESYRATGSLNACVKVDLRRRLAPLADGALTIGDRKWACREGDGLNSR